MSVGFNLLQYVDLRSHRNVFVMAAALFFGVALPQWIGQKQNQKYLATGTAFCSISIHILQSRNTEFFELIDRDRLDRPDRRDFLHKPNRSRRLHRYFSGSYSTW